MPTAHASLLAADSFVLRHLGPRPGDVDEMVRTLGYATLDEFIAAVVPEDIRLKQPLALPPGRGEGEVLQALRGMAAQNKVFRSFIGMGYYPCFTPQVIQRNVMENAGWYTAYTPYQAEIAQGRLEALLNYQTMVSDLTGLEIANASLLDESTAAAEAMHLTEAATKHDGDLVYLVSDGMSPPDDRGGAHARRGARDHGGRGRPRDVHVRSRCDGRAVAVSRDRRQDRGLPRLVRSGARGGRARGGRHRSAGAHDARASRRVGRRHRGGLEPALRRTDGIRRPARGVLCHAGRVQAAPPRPHHRRVARPGGATGTAHGAADAGAAHPPREGDEQRLHGAGAARGDGQHVRGVPRPGRVAPHCGARPHAHGAPRHRAETAGLPHRAHRFL